MCPGRGECGLGRVGDVLVRMRLFRLLVRQLEEKHTHTHAGCKHLESPINNRKKTPLCGSVSSLTMYSASVCVLMFDGVCVFVY